jgi:hypothetical protein
MAQVMVTAGEINAAAGYQPTRARQQPSVRPGRAPAPAHSLSCAGELWPYLLRKITETAVAPCARKCPAGVEGSLVYLFVMGTQFRRALALLALDVVYLRAAVAALSHCAEATGPRETVDGTSVATSEPFCAQIGPTV